MRLYSKYIKTVKTKKQKVYYLMFINGQYWQSCSLNLSQTKTLENCQIIKKREFFFN
jgi:hypothetical protein